jgi:hypothetical protein
MRLSLFIFLHVIVLIILLIVHPHVRAEDDGWAIEEHSKEYIYLTKRGEVVHGDKLIFSMEYKDCDTIFHLFTVLTTRAPEDIIQFENQKVPIDLNGHDLTAKVIYIQPVLKNKANWLVFELGEYETIKYSNLLSGFLKENDGYEITLKDGINYKVENYFDIYRNNWKLNNFSEKISETYKRCKQKTTVKES